jgi:hypothetical protein
LGEVAIINDSVVDNYFYDIQPYSGEIEEDEPILTPLTKELDMVL